MLLLIDAIFKDGVLIPQEPLNLSDGQRVRITIQRLEESEAAPMDREEALRRFREGRERTRFKSEGPYPSREELHERD